MVVMMFGYGGGWPFWEVALMWAGMVAFWGLLIWAVYALVVTATRKPHRGQDPQPGSAARTLDERLPPGDIDTQEDHPPRRLVPRRGDPGRPGDPGAAGSSSQAAHRSPAALRGGRGARLGGRRPGQPGRGGQHHPPGDPAVRRPAIDADLAQEQQTVLPAISRGCAAALMPRSSLPAPSSR